MLSKVVRYFALELVVIILLLIVGVLAIPYRELTSAEVFNVVSHKRAQEVNLGSKLVAFPPFPRVVDNKSAHTWLCLDQNSVKWVFTRRHSEQKD